jgi:hypothetical protein
MWLDPAENEKATLSEPEKDAIREQLGRLLMSSFFRHSKRLPMLLRFVIEHTLAGDVGSIKERTLGVEIFGRSVDYETATDPIVRVTAAELRKRVAQYYQEPGHRDELRISLPSGSYVPQFHWPEGVNDVDPHSGADRSDAQNKKRLDSTAEEAGDLPPARGGEPGFETTELTFSSDEPSPQTEANPETRVGHTRRHFALITGITCVTAGLVSVGLPFISRAIHRSSIDFFWGPLLSARDPVLICVADQLQDTGVALRDTTDPARIRWFNDPLKENAFPTVAIDNVNVIVKLTAILQSNGRQYEVKGERATNLADLRFGPAIFVGGFDNAWTLRLANSLRFRFANDPDMGYPRIIDSTAPTKLAWTSDQSQMKSLGHYSDYAIVARFTDSNTGKLAVIVAGIGRCGSLAAGQFLSDTSDLADLESAARAAGNKQNMELVLSTQVIDGQPGSPKIEAAHFW